LQGEAGLTTDGKAGPQVRLALTSWSGNTPTLCRSNARSASNAGSRNHTNARPKDASPQQSAAVVSDVANETVAAAEETVVAENANQKSENAFETVTENTADISVAASEKPVMALPDAADSGMSGMRFVPSFAAEREPSLPGQATEERDLGLMEVRELPEPFAEPIRREKPFVDTAVTEPVYSSSPIVPHREM